MKQGNGDEEHPEEDHSDEELSMSEAREFDRCMTAKSIDYTQVDYTISRERKEWKKL